MATTYVGRDPCARGEYRRESHTGKAAGQCCDWCGQQPKTLYSYTWEPDGYGTPERKRTTSLFFCNRQCHTSYHS